MRSSDLQLWKSTYLRRVCSMTKHIHDNCVYPNTGVRSITWENTFAWKTLTIRENFFLFSSVWIRDFFKHAQLQHGKSDVASSIFIFFLNVWTSNSFHIIFFASSSKKQMQVSSRTCVRSSWRAIRKAGTHHAARVCDRWIRVTASNAVEITTHLIGSRKVLLHWAKIKRPEVTACLKKNPRNAICDSVLSLDQLNCFCIQVLVITFYQVGV